MKKAVRQLALITALAMLAIGCSPGKIFGPRTTHVSIVVSSRMPEDDLMIWINGREMGAHLTDAVPVRNYWVDILDQNQNTESGTSFGTVSVSARSAKLGRVSITKTQTAWHNQAASFTFGPSDFNVY